jgi:hypothetical protein
MRIITVFLFSVTCFSQVTFNVQITGDPVVAITISPEGLAAGTKLLTSTVGPGTSPTTLTSPVTSSATTFSVANALGVTSCMGVKIGSEVGMISAVSGNNLTMVRGALGTTPAAYTSGTSLSYIAWGNGTCYLAWLYQLGMQAAAQQAATAGPLVTTQLNAITSAQASISSTVGTLVTHVP